MKETIVTDDGKEYSVAEIVHSTRIQKSATPKGTLDWYLKWIASVWLLVAISMRSTGLPELHIYDMLLSFAGTALWGCSGFYVERSCHHCHQWGGLHHVTWWTIYKCYSGGLTLNSIRGKINL